MSAPLVALALFTLAPALPAPSADDCAVAVALGKKVLGWGDKPSEFAVDPALAAEAKLFGGVGSVDLRRCHWKDLGAPLVETARRDSAHRFWVLGPTYDQGSGASATLVIAQMPAADAPKDARPVFSAISCNLTKTDTDWSVAGCKVEGVS